MPSARADLAAVVEDYFDEVLFLDDAEELRQRTDLVDDLEAAVAPHMERLTVLEHAIDHAIDVLEPGDPGDAAADEVLTALRQAVGRTAP